MSIEWTERAADDLDRLVEYIEQDDRPAAGQVGREILAAVSRLESFPGMGRPGRVQGTRELVLVPRALPYVVVYEVSGESIFILRVLHSAQEWPPRQ
ncbi:MAG: type II toxin-antitoxin system RelE/ParE family toxin [Acidobacteriota bacterium]